VFAIESLAWAAGLMINDEGFAAEADARAFRPHLLLMHGGKADA
jgi:hypothetical protein